MSSESVCLDTLERYLKARIPFISLRTADRSRALGVLKKITEKLSMTVYKHTISQGTREIVTERQINEDRSVAGALAFATDQMASRQNLTFVFTEVSDIEDDTPGSRQFQDTVLLAVENSCSLVVVGNKPIWGPLQRLGLTITLDPPNEDEMRAIIRMQIDPYRARILVEWGEPEEKEAAAILAGITAIEAENVIATLLARGQITKADLVELVQAKDRIFADISGLERVVVQGQEYNIGGLEGLKSWLDRKRPLLTADLRERGIRPPRGVLLVGVPGCGKSLSAKAIAASWGMPLYRLDLASIHGMYHGQSEGRLKDALATADHVSPCVLWIDEIEKGLAGASSAGNDGGTSQRMVGQFLYWLQEGRPRVFVVATANDVSQLPPELLRRGRFDELFFVDLPTPQERGAIIDIYTKRGLKRTLPEPLRTELVDLSEGFAGSDLEAAVKEVTEEAFLHGDGAITDNTFRTRFQNVVPLSKTNPERIDAIRAWGKERAISASGQAIEAPSGQTKARRVVLS